MSTVYLNTCVAWLKKASFSLPATGGVPFHSSSFSYITSLAIFTFGVVLYFTVYEPLLLKGILEAKIGRCRES